MNTPDAYPVQMTYSPSYQTLQVPDVSFPPKPRARRELVPADSKDNMYWMKRTKNNQSAKKSRWKRRCVENALETRMTRLLQENMTLKMELERLKKAVGQGRDDYYSQSEQGYMQPPMTQAASQYYPMDVNAVKTEYPTEHNVNYDVFNTFPGESGQGYGLIMDEEGIKNHLPHKLRHKMQTSRS